METPDLIALYEKYAQDGLVVVGVSIDNSEDGLYPPGNTVAFFMMEYGVPYPLLTSWPSWRAIENDYGYISSIPTTFVIDRRGGIFRKFIGSQSYAAFEQAVLPLLYENLDLRLETVGGQLRLSWPVTQLDLVLEQTEDLAANTWTRVALTPQSDGVTWSVDVPTHTGRRFFRLRGQ